MDTHKLMFGINVDPLHWPDDPASAASLIRRTGANWTRTVLKLSNVSAIQTFIEGCNANEIKTLGVIARESADFSEHPSHDEFMDKIGALYNFYKGYVDIWQYGNQPDNPAPDSWQLTETESNDMVLCGAVSCYEAEPSCGPALVTGASYYINASDLTYEARNIYCPAKSYNGINPPASKPVLVTEYPANIPTLGEKLTIYNRRDNISVIFVFCLSDRMYPGMGLYDVNDKLLPRGRRFITMVKHAS